MDQKGPIPSKAEVYRILAKRYGWTFDQIAEMNAYQQLEAMSLTEDEKITTFSTMEEYQQWQAARTK